MTRRGVSTAEKRAELLAAGEEWPMYPDGTKQIWSRHPSMLAGGGFRPWGWTQRQRKRNRERAALKRVEGGICSTKGCTEPLKQYSGGNFSTYCCAHLKERNGKRLYLGRTYLGTTSQYPAPKEAVIAFARGLREESSLWPA